MSILLKSQSLAGICEAFSNPAELDAGGEAAFEGGVPRFADSGDSGAYMAWPILPNADGDHRREDPATGFVESESRRRFGPALCV